MDEPVVSYYKRIESAQITEEISVGDILSHNNLITYK